VEVFEPEDAYIVVVGGDTWPAGSLIQIELHKHSGGRYNLYFDDTDKLIDGDFLPNNSGFYQTTYVIPLTTDDGEYIIRSRLTTDDDTDVATRPIQVESVPLIRVKEGNIVQPGSDITIQLLHHPANDSFRIYLDDNYLFSMPSDPVGNGERIYDLGLLPGLEGGPFLLESRRDGLTVASTEISIIAADLEITNIEFPPGPPVNQEIPVTVTVRNNSPVSVSGEYFDVDLYLDPLHPPTPGSKFPPGDYKRWMHSVPPMDTVDVLFNLTLRGADHTVYGRVDTSDYIAESNEANNIYQMTVSGGCVAEVTDALSSATKWTGKRYGDTDSGPIDPDHPPVSGGVITLTSDGSSAFGSSDNMYLAYYNPEMISGDFEVRVRMVGGPGAGSAQWARGGLEIRDDVGSPSSAKVELAVVNSQHVGFQPAVQSAYRDGGDTTRPAGAALDVGVAYPVWLRIVRSGNRFLYYYSDSNAATPPAESDWIAHGSVEMANMGRAVTVGLFNASYDSSRTDTSRFDKLHICVKGAQGPPPGEDFPPGLTVCTGNLIQNGGFEGSQLLPWRAPNGAVNDDFSPGYEGQEAALMYTYRQQEPHHQPVLAQDFTMPEWVISSTTTINLSLYRCARDYPGSGPEPDDHLNVGLRSTGNLISDPILVADGGTANTSTCVPTDYTLFSSDLAEAIKAAGGDTQDYAGQELELYVYDTSSDPSTCRPPNGLDNPACYETHFYLDNVGLDICTSQPVPDPEPGKAYKVGGPLRVFIGGAPQPKQGVRVWTYQPNGELLTTYSLHDSTYFFYNVDPGEYVIYSEYWDGPNLYSAFTTANVNAGQNRDDLSLLLR